MESSITRFDSRFEGVTFKMVDPSMDEEVKDFLWKHHFTEEPVRRSLGIKRNPFFDKTRLDEALKDRSSMAAVDRNGRLLAVRLGKVARKSDRTKKSANEISGLCSPELSQDARSVRNVKIVTKLRVERLEYDVLKFFDEYNCTTIYEAMGVCSSREHGIRGLGSELVRRCEEVSKQRGCTHAIVLTTTKYSKIAFEALGYTCLKTLPYCTFVNSKGELYLKDTREHTEAASFIKKY